MAEKSKSIKRNQVRWSVWASWMESAKSIWESVKLILISCPMPLNEEKKDKKKKPNPQKNPQKTKPFCPKLYEKKKKLNYCILP